MITYRLRQILSLTATVATTSLLRVPAFAQGASAGARFAFRGFTVDMSATQSAPNFEAMKASVKHQIDIAADCGASPALMTFFKSQDINVQAGQGDGGGHFSANSKGISVDAAVQPPEQPIILHELLHAYHFRVLPQAGQNPDLLRFYNIAKNGELYPPDSYVLKNVREFFAVTGSLYLWGNVDRPPRTRDNLRQKQPVYYTWLGQLFGVQK